MNKLDNTDSNSADRPVEPIHFTSEEQKERPGFLKRLLEVINPTTKKEIPHSLKKVHAHREDARFVKEELIAIKKELVHEDPEFAAMVLEVINPLLRSVDRIKRIHPKEGNATDIIEQIHSWTESAKLWVELLSKTKDVEEIKEAISEHIIEKSIERVEKDIRFIEEYLDQHVNHLHRSDEMREMVKQEREPAVQKHIESLKTLMQPPESKSFKVINLWRQLLDEQRTLHLEAALQEIEGDSSPD